MTTVHCELELGRNTGGSYPVVARAAGRVATSRLPVASVEALERQLVVVSKSVPVWSGIARPATVEDELQVREWGRQLFETLVVDEVRDLYIASRQQAGQPGNALRLVFGRACDRAGRCHGHYSPVLSEGDCGETNSDGFFVGCLRTDRPPVTRRRDRENRQRSRRTSS